MGGERENTAPQKGREARVPQGGAGRGRSGKGAPEAPATPPEPEAMAAQAAADADLRFHVSGGEMHFHDDVRKLKVAVRIADWYERLRDLLYSPTGSRQNFIDRQNRTVLMLSLSWWLLGEGAYRVEASVELCSCEVGPTLNKLLETTGW